jgi:hypothetical protein
MVHPVRDLRDCFHIRPSFKGGLRENCVIAPCALPVATASRRLSGRKEVPSLCMNVHEYMKIHERSEGGQPRAVRACS